MRKALVLGTLTLALAGAVVAQPASALPVVGEDTTVTFAVGTAGGVSILPSPAVVALPSGNAVVGVLTSVVTDLRVSGGTWTDTISSTDYSLVGATAPSGTSLIPASSAKIFTTSATVAIPGTATVSNLHTDLASALALSNDGQQLISATTTNVNVTTLVSTVQIDTTGKATGAYTGTISQTVS